MTDSNGDYHERKERQKNIPEADRSDDLRRASCGDVCRHPDCGASGFSGLGQTFPSLPGGHHRPANPALDLYLAV